MFKNTLTFFKKDSNEPLTTGEIEGPFRDSVLSLNSQIMTVLEIYNIQESPITVESIIQNDNKPLEQNTYNILFNLTKFDRPSAYPNTTPDIKAIDWKHSIYKATRIDHKNLTNNTPDFNKPIFTIKDLMDKFREHAIGLLSANNHAHELLTDDDYYKLAEKFLSYYSDSEPITEQIEDLLWSYVTQEHIV